MHDCVPRSSRARLCTSLDSPGHAVKLLTTGGTPLGPISPEELAAWPSLDREWLSQEKACWNLPENGALDLLPRDESPPLGGE